MTHKQVKFGKGKRSQKEKPVEDEYDSGSASRRAVLLSSDDVERLAEESSRARLINHLVSKSEDHHATREFASYYRGSSRYIEPPYSITSHTNRVYIPQALQVIPTYQSLIQTPQWSPYMRQMPGESSQTDLTMNRKYNCRCVECQSADCPTRSSSTFRPRRLKDNIMTFCDQYTMTRILNDANCGSTPTPSTLDCLGVSVSRQKSVIGLRDQEKFKIYEVSNKLGTYTPVPILKKGYTAEPVNNDGCRPKLQDEYNKIQPRKSMSIECFFKKREDNGTRCKSSRKNLYNEGISDVTLKFPPSPKRQPRCPATPMRARSKVTMSSEGSDSDNIQHSHRSHSRYHKYCVDMPRLTAHNDSVRGRAAVSRARGSSPKISPSKTSSGKRSKQQQQRIIRLPKKVLTSDKLADACARKSKPPCTRK